MKLKISNCLMILDVFEVVLHEEADQNNGKIGMKLAYAINKNKEAMGKVIEKDKKFMENFTKYLEYLKDNSDIELKFSKITTKTESQKVGLEKEMNDEKDELKAKNQDVIDKQQEWLQKEVNISDSFYKIKVDYFPNLPKQIVDFLLDYGLITE